MIAAGATAVATLQIYARFAGEHPVLDAVRDRELRRADLRLLDRRAALLGEPARIVVTLTTLPSRIDRVGLTIKSLLSQTRRPREIRIYIPERSRREDTAYVIPEWLAALESIRIIRCDHDYGPSTKVLPALLSSADPDQPFLVVDDDRIYQPWLVAQMEALSETNPNLAIAGSGWDAPPDLLDHPTRLADTLLGRAPAPIKCTRVSGRRDVDVMQGFSGYVVRPRFFRLEELADYAHAPAAAFFVDDVWISAHCNVPKAVMHGRRTNFMSRRDAAFFKRTSLGMLNRGDGSFESRNNTILLKHFADRWRRTR